MGLTHLEPRLHGVGLAGYDLDDAVAGLAGCVEAGNVAGQVGGRLGVEVVADLAETDVAKLLQVALVAWVGEDAPLEALVGREVHVGGVGNGGAVHDEAVLADGVLLLDDACPYAIGILAHREGWLAVVELYPHFLGVGGVETQDDTGLVPFGRGDLAGEERGHGAGCELCLLAGLGEGGGGCLHGLARCFLVK